MKEKGWMKKMKYRGLEDHMRRMREMKPVVDDKPPRAPVKSNRREMARRRHYEAIEFDNKLMLERLAKALQKKTIDNDTPKLKAMGSHESKVIEMRRLADENNRILRRIREAKSAYDHVQWEEDAKQREKYILNMSEFSPQNINYTLPSGEYTVRKECCQNLENLNSAYEMIFQFKITLRYSKPPIWRRVLVRSSSTFKEFSVVILSSMGWDDSHLHSFTVTNPKTGRKVEISQDNEFEESGIEESEVLSSFFSLEHSKGSFLYDFGDNWEHTLLLEKILEEDATQTYPQCIAGKRACPPEDCGGIGGYFHILECLADPENPNHEERLDWVGEYNPEAFDPKKVKFQSRDERFLEMIAAAEESERKRKSNDENPSEADPEVAGDPSPSLNNEDCHLNEVLDRGQKRLRTEE